jgi:hypothetical protein
MCVLRMLELRAEKEASEQRLKAELTELQAEVALLLDAGTGG